MVLKGKPAAITEKAFNCPHCGAFTSQEWKGLCTFRVGGENELPFCPDLATVEAVKKDFGILSGEDKAAYAELLKIANGRIFTYVTNPIYSTNTLKNLHISICFTCGEVSVWVHDKLVYPAQKYQIEANPDLPDDILRDFEEARAIVDDSPRGAAALLRLAIQKICIHLGEKGKHIDADIKSLVEKGLSPKIQQALDIVRVIGNDAVHPGELNLNDNKAIAYKLFDFVNIIAEEMISRPKEIEDLYNGLPASKLEGIENRDNVKKK